MKHTPKSADIPVLTGLIDQIRIELTRKQKAIKAIWRVLEDDYNYPACNTPEYQAALELLKKESERQVKNE